MEPARYDILRREKNGAAIWLETSADLSSARCRIKQIVSFWPGTYEVAERESQTIVAAVGDGARLRAPVRRTWEYARKRCWKSYAWLLAPWPRVANLARYKEVQGYAWDCCQRGCEWLCGRIFRIEARRSR
jgi:hypothetical protein